MNGKITKSAVDRLKPGETLWDNEMRGFGVRCQKKSKTYVLKKSIGGKQRLFTIGPHGSPWTPQQARDKAKEILGDIAAGKPVHEVREGKKDRMTVRDLGERFLEEHAKVHKKPSSWKSDESNLRNHIYPLLGNMMLDEVTTAIVDRFVADVSKGKTAAKPGTKGFRGGKVSTGGKGAANRSRTLLGTMFNFAERWKESPKGSNPVPDSNRFHEEPKEYFLTHDEIKRIASVMDNDSNPYAVAAIRLLMVVGARKSEILKLRWSEIDRDRNIATIPDSKTGRKKLFLSPAALGVLDNISRISGNPYVICGKLEGQHLVGLPKAFKRICADAGLEGIRLHDLRHTFGSLAAQGGASLPLIGKLLGHKNTSTTQRYAHLVDMHATEVNEKVGDILNIGSGGLATGHMG